MEVLEFDDLRVRVEKVTDEEVEARKDAGPRDLRRSPTRSTTRTSTGRRGSRSGLDRLVEDFDARQRGLLPPRPRRRDRTSASAPGMILGSSLLTARGVPMAGEYELRTIAGDAHLRPASARAARSPSSRHSTSATAWSRWATTGRRTWRSARAAAPARPRRLPRQARLGRERRVRRHARAGHDARRRPGARRHAHAHRLRGRGRSPGRCWRSATRPRESTSAATRAVDRRLERVRRRPPLGARDRPPRGGLPRCRGSASAPLRGDQGLSGRHGRIGQ